MNFLFKVLSSLLLLFAIFAIEGQDFKKLLTVSSSIEISSNGEEVLKSGEFTVPEGYEAVNLRFRYSDIINGQHTDKLKQSNLFDTDKKEPIDIVGEIKSIPAGKYQLKISGAVGSCAVLVYDLKPAKIAEKEPKKQGQ